MTTSDLLSPRFQYDKKSVVSFNDLQRKTRETVERKVESDDYNFIKPACPICDNSDEWDILSEKDRYGLYHPVKACCVCGLVQTNPRMTEDAYGEFYDSEYRLLYDGNEDYAKTRFESQKEKGKEVYGYLHNTIPNKLDGSDVLDIGCGPGGMPAYFQSEGHRVAGCDLDNNAVTYGKNQGIPLQEGTVEEIDLDWKPDIVILSHVVEHFLSPVEDLIQVRELIHENSVVYIELPGINWLSPFRTYYNSDFLEQLQNAHTYYFTARSLENLLTKAGFESIEIDESIQSVFTPSKNGDDTEFESDYPAVVDHLNRLEKWKQWGISPIPTSPHSLYTHPAFISLLKRTGVYPYARKFYHRLHS
jgi:2-polyprenyl-3-methyl-5-hydroxy-6-metoxy-1,4-benzoquinol methylase